MNSLATNERQEAHTLLDLLPPLQLAAVHGLLQAIVDPLDRKLALAPLDDEPESDEEKQAAAAALDSLRRGGVPMETVLADFGLSMEDFHRLAEAEESSLLSHEWPKK